MAQDDGMTRMQRTLLKQVTRDLQQALGDPASRRVLMRIIDSAGVFQRSFAGNDALTTAHREGRRSVGLDLVEQIEAVVPGSFATLQQEALALRQRNERDKQNEVGYDDE